MNISPPEKNNTLDLEAIQKSAEALLSTLDLKEVLDLILRQLYEVVAFTSASIMLARGDHLEIVVQKGFRSDTQYFSYDELGKLEHIQEALLSKHPIIIQNTEIDSRWYRLPDSEYINSWLGIPLVVRNSAIGILNVDMDQPNFFREEHQNAVVTFAKFAAIAIENAKLFSEAIESNQYKEILISNSFDPIIAINESKKITVFNRKAEQTFGYKASEMIGRSVARLHKDLVVAGQIYDKIHSDGVTSSFQVDLLDKDGNIIPCLLSAQALFDSNGKNLGQVGFIKDLRHTKLMEDRLRSLHQATKALNSLLDSDQVLSQVLKLALRSFPNAQRGSIHILDQKSQKLMLASSSYDYSMEAKNSVEFELGEGIAGWVFEHQKPLVLPNAAEDPRYKQVSHTDIPTHKAMIAVPLRAKETAIGVLCLTNIEDGNVFRIEDLELLSGFGDQVGLAIANANSLKQSAKNVTLMTRLVEESHKIVKTFTLEEQLMQAWEFVSHGLSAPIFYVGIYDKHKNVVSFPLFFEMGERQFPENISLSDNNNLGLSGFMIQKQRSIEWFSKEQKFVECEKLGIKPITTGMACETCIAELLIIGNEIIGVISMQSERPNAWGEVEVRLFRMLANQTAVSIRNSQLFDSLHQSKLFLQHAYEASKKVTSASTLAEAATLIGEQAQIMGSSWTNIILFDDKQNPNQNFTIGFERPLSLDNLVRPDGISREVLNTKIPKFIEDVSLVSTKVHPGLIADKTRAALCLPLYSDNDNIGVVWCHFKDRRPFTPEERDAWQLYASHAAITLKRVELINRLTQEINVAEILSEVSAHAALRATMEIVVSGTQQVLRCDNVTLYTYDDGEKTFGFPPAMIGVQHMDKVLELGYIAETSAPYKIVNHDGLYITENTKNDSLVKGNFATRENVEATVGIPLIVKSQKVGVMFVNYCSPHKFSSDDILCIKLYANFAAVAIHNAQQFEYLRKLQGFIGGKTAIDWIRMVSQVWGHSVRREVGTALGAIQGIRNSLSKLKQSVRGIETELNNLEEIVRNIREIPIIAPLSVEDGISPVRVNELIKSYVKFQFRHPGFRSVKLNLQLPEDLDAVTVHASPQWLRRALEIVIENAVEALLEENGPAKEIKISSQVIGESIEISIQDNGPGFPEHLRELAFREPLDKAHGSKGAGLGLVIAATICETFGGRIELRSKKDRGTDMTIILPLDENGK